MTASAQQVALTFDDLPAHSSLPPGVTRQQVITDILSALKASGTPPVYGFVNGVRIEEHAGDARVLDLWRKAGYPLGNHTWSHMNLNEHTAEEWESDLLRNEPVIESRMKGADWRWLRFPFLAEGDTPNKSEEVRTFLADHHYRIAGVTTSFGDYAFNDPYARCMAKNDSAAIATLESRYLQAAKDDLADRKGMMQTAFGHEIPLVLLMHVGAFDARMLPRLLALYKQQGVTFISLEQAEGDPFYRNDLDPRLPARPDTLEAAVAAKHLAQAYRATSLADLNQVCK